MNASSTADDTAFSEAAWEEVGVAAVVNLEDGRLEESVDR